MTDLQSGGDVQLDYAYLADYAVVQDEALTAVRAGFITLPGALPFERNVAVAGRLRRNAGPGTFDMGVRFAMAQGAAPVEVIKTLPPTLANHYHGNEHAVLFATTQLLRFSAAGLVTVTVSFGARPMRTINFEVLGR